MVVGLCVWWVWWVLIEEYVGLYVMQCFVVGFRGSDRGGAGRGRQEREGIASGLEKFYYVYFFFFLNIADMENCERFKSFGYIYIYIYI